MQSRNLCYNTTRVKDVQRLEWHFLYPCIKYVTQKMSSPINDERTELNLGNVPKTHLEIQEVKETHS